MRVVFMGTPSFAVPTLEALRERHDLVAVYTRPDKPAGRGRTPVASPVKQRAVEYGIPVFQPSTLRAAGEAEMLERLRPDVVCVAAYGMLLPDEILAVPPLGCINVHASLLPAYRGAAPIQRAILDGAPITGVSIMRIVRELDAGPYAAQVELEVDERDYASLADGIAEAGAAALLAVLGEVEAGTVVWIAQDDAGATYAPKVTAADVALHPDLGALDALRRVRASTPSAPARLRIGATRATVLEAGPAAVAARPGAIVVGKDELALGLADGTIAVVSVKPEGRGAMDGAAFARGARLGGEASWGAWE